MLRIFSDMSQLGSGGKPYKTQIKRPVVDTTSAIRLAWDFDWPHRTSVAERQVGPWFAMCRNGSSKYLATWGKHDFRDKLERWGT